MAINLSDRYVTLLDETLDENRTLRQQMKESDFENRQQILELKEKVDTLCQRLEEREPTKGKRKQTRKAQVPRKCRNEFRAMYKLLMKEDENFPGFVLEESIASSSNRQLVKTVTNAVIADHGGEEKCPWSSAQLKDAASTYLRTLRDSKIRKLKNGANHNTVCRRQIRKREKLVRRQWALENRTTTGEIQQRVQRVMDIDYMSSEESGIDSDDESVKVLFVKAIPWESDKLRTIKDKLDELYCAALPSHVKNYRTKRVPVMESSGREMPEEPEEWAVKRPIATSTPLRSVQRRP